MARSLDPNTFPWPALAPDAAPGIGALATAMAWPDLSVTERVVAIYIADGWLDSSESALVTEDSLTRLAGHLALGVDDVMRALWALLEAGLLAHLAGWWAR